MKVTFAQRFIIVAGSLFFVLTINSTANEKRTISRDAAVLDKGIPETVREAFQDDNGKPMKSVSVDLNNDKHPEKLIPNDFLCGNGGCPWLIYSPALNKVIGHVFGNTLVILDTATEGYKSIQSRWSLGASKTGAAVYTFRKGVYEQQ